MPCMHFTDHAHTICFICVDQQNKTFVQTLLDFYFFFPQYMIFDLFLSVAKSKACSVQMID